MRNKIVNILLACLTLMLLTGCSSFLPDVRDITEFELISIAGVDAATDAPDKIALTLSAKEGGIPGQSQPKSDKPLLLTNEAESISRALQEMEAYTDKHLFLGHTHYYLIGEGLAKQDVGKAIDFLIRDTNTRLDTKVFIVKDNMAQELLSKASSNNAFVADRLLALEKDMQQLSNSRMVSVVDIANALDDGGIAIIPTLKMVPVTDHDITAGEGKEQPSDSVPSSKDMERSTFDLAGIAIIDNYKFTDHIEIEKVQGLNILKNNFFFDILEINTEAGKTVALQMENAKCKYSLEWSGETPSKLIVDVSFNSMVREIHDKIKISDTRFIEETEQKQNELIYNRLEYILNLSQEKKLDFVGLSDALYRKYPIRFAEVRNRWKEIWPTLPIEIRVKSSITSSFNLVNPNGTEGE